MNVQMSHGLSNVVKDIPLRDLTKTGGKEDQNNRDQKTVEQYERFQHELRMSVSVATRALRKPISWSACRSGRCGKNSYS